jgi:uncharacterized protein (TIGR02145 family)
MSIDFEILNEQKDVIGKQTLRLTPYFSLSANSNGDQIIVNDFKNIVNTVVFNAVDANKITDKLSIRISSVDGASPKQARFRITALSASNQAVVSSNKQQGGSQKDNIFVDSRDGNTYKFVKIGNKVWMTENLKYETKFNEGSSWCYDNNSSNCNKYGRLYDWNAAKGACPTGWRLPTQANDWTDLVSTADGVTRKTFGSMFLKSKIAGKKLKSKTDWNAGKKGKGGNGTDELGFLALSGGWRSSGGDYYDIGSKGRWWVTEHGTRDDQGRNRGTLMEINSDGDEIDGYWMYERAGASVRCVRD